MSQSPVDPNVYVSQTIEVLETVTNHLPESARETDLKTALPNATEAPGQLRSCAPARESDTSASQTAMVYYIDTLATAITTATDQARLINDLTDELLQEPDWTVISTSPKISDHHHTLRSPTGLEVDIYTSVGDKARDRPDLFLVSATSPCFVPEPPYKAGDEL
ncbi:hypothetical protein [Gulosibacter bifidus]|uniref:Uncharacterized protein n=1 Tax=Gulosibacter bifidus TaxID=272239 RepID=A0ABW5RIJ0_9MICO|nr:hypothetical protein [Gulosibacter bifidus]